MNRRPTWTLLAWLSGIAGCSPAAPPAATAPAALPIAAAPATAAVDPAPPKGLHLPRTALPTKYALDLEIKTNDTKLVGTVAIDLALASAANVVWLHGRNITVREAHFEVGPSKLPARVISDAKKE